MPKRKMENEDMNSTKAKKSTNNGKKHWSLGLLDAMKDPELQVQSDDLVVVIKDKFPKAKFHYLILPQENISNLKKLTTDHLKLLEHMETIANELIKKDIHNGHSFKCGYHAEASMHRLHMHVISDDMVSPSLKTKKHWNSFTTEFFLSHTYIHKCLKENGKIDLPSADECKKYINAPLVCHKCEYVPKHIPNLKEHIVSHLKK